MLRIFLKIRMDRKCFVFNQPVVIREKYGTKHITYLFTNVCIIHIYKDLYMYIHTHVFSNLSGVGDWVIVAPIVDDIFRVKRVQIGI